MLLGRLEILTMLVLITPVFWRYLDLSLGSEYLQTRKGPVEWRAQRCLERAAYLVSLGVNMATSGEALG